MSQNSDLKNNSSLICSNNFNTPNIKLNSKDFDLISSANLETHSRKKIKKKNTITQSWRLKKEKESEEIINQKFLNLALDDQKKLSFLNRMPIYSNKSKGFTIIQKIASKQNYKDRIIKWYILLPNSKIMKIWSGMNLFIILYSISIIPLFNAFSLYENNIIFDSIEYFIDVFFIIDFIKNFFLSYINEHNKLELDILTIISRYIFTWFILDLVTAIPFSLIFLFIKGNVDRDLLISLRTLKILRIFKFLKNFKIYLNIIIFGANIKPYNQRIISMIIIICVLFHNITCLWIIIGTMDKYKRNWIKSNHINFDSNNIIYLYGLYWTTQTIFTVGYGDIGAYNVLELLFAILIMFVGVFIYSFLVSTISSIINLLDFDEGKFNKNIITLKKINKSYNLSKKLFNKIKFFFKGNSNINDKEEELLNNLEEKVQKDLYYEMNSFKLKDIEFFEENNSKDFIAFISKFLKVINFEKNENIYLEDEISENIFFIKKGSVSLEKLYKNKSIQIVILRKGNLFGEIEFISGKINRMISVYTLSKVEVLAINHKFFQEIIFNKFPVIGMNFLKKSIERKLVFLKNFEKRKSLDGKLPRILEKHLNNKITAIEKDHNIKMIELYQYDINKYNFISEKQQIYHFMDIIMVKNSYLKRLIKRLNTNMNNKRFEKKCSKYYYKKISSKHFSKQESMNKNYNINIMINKYYYMDKNEEEKKKRNSDNNLINNIMNEIK